MKAIVYIPVIEDGKEAVRTPKKGEYYPDVMGEIIKAHEDLDAICPIFRRVEVEVPEGLEGHTSGPWKTDGDDILDAENDYIFDCYDRSLNADQVPFIVAAVNFLSAIIKAGEE